MKKLIFIISFVVLSGFLFGFTAPNAKAATVAELQAQIQQLLAQVAALQQQLAQLQAGGGGEVWCHTFNVNLKIGNTGSEVTALQTALSKEGLYNRGVTGTFDEYTASAVVAFQEKYVSEILTPLGLTHGTGFVGSATRTKLNQIYSCGVVRPYIKVISPNGGERWEIGKTYDIKWQSSGLETIEINLYNSSSGTAYGIADDIQASLGSYSWIISNNIPKGSNYLIQINGNYKGAPMDSSDNYFSIVSPTTTICIDSDDFGNSINYYTKRSIYTCTGSSCTSARDDFCLDQSNLKEYYCGKDSTIRSEIYTCPKGYNCKDGACVSVTSLCTDSDDGKNYYVKGSCSDKIQTYTDNCLLNVVNEWYCDSVSNSCKNEVYTCPYGCQDGACLKSVTPSITITYPTTGEILQKGSTIFINLQFSPSVPKGGFAVNLLRADSDVAIAHLKYCGATGYTQDNAMPVNVSWAWKVGYDVDGKEILNGSYRILVYDCGARTDSVWLGNTASAKSGVFSIVSGELGLKSIESQLASLTVVISQLIEQLRNLLGR